ncbi:hypothetical protein HN789_06915 [archaeon]|jgi:hypothetical protein|nr:hypothetical protein [archaeon]MBT4022704.1 hypothetical protein [archaeon]MBT4273102.1 hypothetical protein [archaeon]MBT4461083.1 hypothetical protein [archaeon]MBT4858752.1 hypothetical protein [archaeon]
MNSIKFTQKTLRKFHLDQFPKKELYLVINKSFRDSFFDVLSNKIGGTTILSRKLGVGSETVRRWKVGDRTFPNWALLQLNNLLRKEKFSVEVIEKNIEIFRGESSSYRIIDLVFPLVEDERLIRILTHLMCDGYSGGSKHLPTYVNTEKELIKLFVNDLSVFGNVSVSIRKRKTPKGNKHYYSVEFPRIFKHILKEIYQSEFYAKTARLPKHFFNLNEKLSSEIIKCFGDDEGSVRESSITFGLSNRYLLEDFRNILVKNLRMNDKLISEVKKVPEKTFYNFQVNRNLLKKYYDLIGFNHPDKRKRLEFILSRESRSGNKYPKGVAKQKIVDLLAEKPSSAISLGMKVGIKPKNIRFHLNNLKKENKIHVSSLGENNTKIWSVTK